MALLGLILAGGAGRRMGGADKALLMLAGRPLLAHVQARLGPQVAGLALSANGPAARFGGLGLPVLPDPPGHGGDGPLAGILAGLDWAADQGAQALLTCPVDTPFVPTDLGARLAQARARGSAQPAVAESGGRMHPGCALWPVGLRGALRAELAGGARRLGRFASDHGAQRVAFAGTPDPFFNINTPEDLARAEAALSQTSPSPGPAA